MVLPLSTNVVERLSENSEQASFCGPTRLHNGMKRYSHRRLALPKTRDPTRPAIFQTVSRRIILRSSPRIHCEFIAARYGLGGVGPTSEQLPFFLAPIHPSAWKGYSPKFASTGVWEVLLAEAADNRLPSRTGSRIPSGPVARIPPSWAAGLFRAPLRSRAGRNGPKGAWTGPGPPETMPDRGGRADLGGGVGPSSCSRTVLLSTPVPCRSRSSIPTDGETSFSEVRRHGVLRSSRVHSVLLGLFVSLHVPARGTLEASREQGVLVSECFFQLLVREGAFASSTLPLELQCLRRAKRSSGKYTCQTRQDRRRKTPRAPLGRRLGYRVRPTARRWSFRASWGASGRSPRSGACSPGARGSSPRPDRVARARPAWHRRWPSRRWGASRTGRGGWSSLLSPTRTSRRRP